MVKVNIEKNDVETVTSTERETEERARKKGISGGKIRNRRTGSVIRSGTEAKLCLLACSHIT